jgi:hypothetical protein
VVVEVGGGHAEAPRCGRGLILVMGLVVIAMFRGDAGGQAEVRLSVIHSPRQIRGMVICDRDRTGSIKEATTPPADGGQTQNDPRPVTSEPAHTAALPAGARARICPSRKP